MLAEIVAEQYHAFPGTTLTVCALTLQNGFQVTGESAAASPDNFDEEIGRKIQSSGMTGAISRRHSTPVIEATLSPRVGHRRRKA
ncbi:Gp49 family protein [Rhizobium ruizarguesonis]